MSPTPLDRLDPNFEGLLREAAAAPRSMLLRVERPQIFPTLRSREAPVSVAMAGLSSVERELLASYRCELGFLLRQSTLMALMEDATTKSWIDSGIERGQAHRLPTTDEWSHRASQSIDAAGAPTDTECAEAHRLIRKMATEGMLGLTVPQLAAASLRVEPADQARIYVGAHFAARGDRERCADVVRSTLDGLSSSSNSTFALEWAAVAAALGRDYVGAVAAIQIALLAGSRRSETSLRLLLYSALAGVSRLIEDAMVHIEREVDAKDIAIDRVCDDIRWQIQGRFWIPTSASRELVRKYQEHSGPVSKRILHELCT